MDKKAKQSDAIIWSAIQTELIDPLPVNDIPYVVALILIEHEIQQPFKFGLMDRLATRAGVAEIRLDPVHETVGRLYALRQGRGMPGDSETSLRAVLRSCGADNNHARRAGHFMAALPGVIARASRRPLH